MNTITVSVDVLNQVMGYLGTRPYQEVFKLITAIQAEASGQIIADPVVEDPVDIVASED
jgi:hypothetical protein